MRIVADTNIWIGHFRDGDAILSEMLEYDFVAAHSIVVGELASGNLPERHQTIKDLRNLPAVTEANFEETLLLLNEQGLYGRGLQWNELLLLASVVASGRTLLLTRDRRLKEAATDLGVSYRERI